MPRFISVAAKRGSLGNHLLPDAPGSSDPAARGQRIRKRPRIDSSSGRGAASPETGAVRAAAIAGTPDLGIWTLYRLAALLLALLSPAPWSGPASSSLPRRLP